MRAATEWKVPSHGMPSSAPPDSLPTRSRISRAALLVKVTARIWLGHARRVAIRWARRAVSAAVLPVPAPARTSTGPSVVIDRLALGRIEALEVRRVGGDRGGLRHLAELGVGERNGNRGGAIRRFRKRFRRLFPISPLSTGFSPHFSLLRLGRGVHGAHVIGTAVPASSDSRQRQDGAAGDQRSDLRRQAVRSTFGFFLGSVGKRRRKSRSSSSATRFPDFRVSFGGFGGSVSKAGRKSGRPKKGR